MATERLARLAGVYSGIIFGLYWIPLRALADAGFPGLWATFVFNLLPLLVLLPVLVFRWRRFVYGRRRFHVNGMLVGVSLVLYASAFLYTDVVRAVLLFYLTPIWGFILARIYLGDRITPVRWVAVGFGIAGLVVILGTEHGFPVPREIGDWMALASGIVWAVASLRLLMDQGSDALDYCIAFFLWCSVAACAIAVIATLAGGLAAADWSSVGPVALWFLPVAVFLLVPGALAVVYSASTLNPGVVGILFMMEVCVATLSSAILTNEAFGLREVIGVLLIIFAGAVEPLWQGWSSRRARANA